MPGTLQWATSDLLVASDTFLATKFLWDTETYLSKLSSCDRWQDITIRDSLHWSRRFEYPWILRTANTRKNHIVLDAGAGPAILQFCMAPHTKELHNLDIDQEALDFVEGIKKESGAFSNIITTMGDIRDIPYEDGHFHKSISISVLEHLPPEDIRKSVDEMLRVTKRDTYITMDICLNRLDDQPSNIITFDQFIDMCTDLEVPVPELPNSIMTGIVDNNYIVVACMELWK